MSKNGIILICLFITSLPPLFFIIHEKNIEKQHEEWLLIKNKLNCSIIKKNMHTHEVYWKCNDGIIYVNNHEN